MAFVLTGVAGALSIPHAHELNVGVADELWSLSTTARFRLIPPKPFSRRNV
jgi:hypothetical protein